MPSNQLTLALALIILPGIAAASSDPKLGKWVCEFSNAPFGTLMFTETTYSFSDAETGNGSTGGLNWVSDTFGLSGGYLMEFGIHSGLVYTPPDQPGTMLVDLYTDLGAVVTCHR